MTWERGPKKTTKAIVKDGESWVPFYALVKRWDVSENTVRAYIRNSAEPIRVTLSDTHKQRKYYALADIESLEARTGLGE